MRPCPERRARFLRQGDPDNQAFHHDLYRAVGGRGRGGGGARIVAVDDHLVHAFSIGRGGGVRPGRAALLRRRTGLGGSAGRNEGAGGEREGEEEC